jgi:hypothetical protein
MDGLHHTLDGMRAAVKRSRQAVAAPPSAQRLPRARIARDVAVLEAEQLEVGYQLESCLATSATAVQLQSLVCSGGEGEGEGA